MPNRMYVLTGYKIYFHWKYYLFQEIFLVIRGGGLEIKKRNKPPCRWNYPLKPIDKCERQVEKVPSGVFPPQDILPPPTWATSPSKSHS